MNALNHSAFRIEHMTTGALLSAVTLAGIPVNTYLPATAPQEPAGPLTATVSRADLTAALDKLRRVVDKRNSIPILDNVSMVAKHGEMTLTATDLDTEMTVTIPTMAADRFWATMPCHLLADIMKKAAKSDTVTFKLSGHYGDVAEVSFAALDYRLNTLPLSDFPEWSPIQYHHRFALAGKELFNMLDAVQVAISTEETRYYLNGVFLHVAEKHAAPKLRATATDGHRCYLQDASAVPDGAEGMPAVIIPRAVVKLVLDLTKGKACPETVNVAVWRTNLQEWDSGGAGQIRFEFGNVSIRAKLVDGTFPDYARVIPTMNPTTAIFDRDAMTEALASVTVMAHERGRAVKLCLEDGYCQLVVANPEIGVARATIDGVSLTGNDHAEQDRRGHAAAPLDIGFNSGYLRAILDDAGAGAITGHFGDAGSPVVLSGSRQGWKAVLMPMRV